MPIIGIDFGGYRLRVASDEHGSPSLIPHRYASERVPFLAGLSEEEGKPRIKVASLKRLLDFDQALPVPPSGRNSLDFVAEMLRKIRRDCEAEGEVNCVMAVPPCFSARQRSAVRTTAGRAGFSSICLADDTLAALLASRESVADCETVLVYSWGASAFSSVLYRQRGSGFQPVAQEGESNLGGDEIDALLASKIFSAVVDMLGGDPLGQRSDLLLRLVSEAEAAKLILAAGENASVPLARLLGGHVPASLSGYDVSLSQEDFLEATNRLCIRTLELVAKVLQSAKCDRPDVVLTAGGMTLVPTIRQALEEQLKTRVVEAREGAVAVGAVLYGRMLPAEEWVKGDPSSPTVGRPEEQSSSASPSSPPPVSAPEPTGRWADNFTPFLDAAQKHYGNDRLADSIMEFEKLFVELAKYSGDLYRRAADAAGAAGSHRDALKILQLANRRDPLNRLVAVDVAHECYRLGAEAWSRKKAGDCLTLAQLGIDALSALPESENVYPAILAQLLHLRGCALCGQGRYAEAESALETSVRLHPDQETYRDDLRKVRESAKSRGPRSAATVTTGKVGRNAQCPCGSGQKYKKCCGR